MYEQCHCFCAICVMSKTYLTSVSTHRRNECMTTCHESPMRWSVFFILIYHRQEAYYNFNSINGQPDPSSSSRVNHEYFLSSLLHTHYSHYFSVLWNQYSLEHSRTYLFHDSSNHLAHFCHYPDLHPLQNRLSFSRPHLSYLFLRHRHDCFWRFIPGLLIFIWAWQNRLHLKSTPSHQLWHLLVSHDPLLLPHCVLHLLSMCDGVLPTLLLLHPVSALHHLSF